MIIATKIMSKVIVVVAMGSMVVVNFIPSFSFLMTMATIRSTATRTPSLMNLLYLLQHILERNGYLRGSDQQWVGLYMVSFSTYCCELPTQIQHV
jgi:hypothetical protein